MDALNLVCRGGSALGVRLAQRMGDEGARFEPGLWCTQFTKTGFWMNTRPVTGVLQRKALA